MASHRNIGTQPELYRLLEDVAELFVFLVAALRVSAISLG
jgi:hypothetical protein